MAAGKRTLAVAGKSNHSSASSARIDAEGTKRLAVLDSTIELVPDASAPGVREQRTMTQCPRPELVPSLKPAHDLPFREQNAAMPIESATRSE